MVRGSPNSLVKKFCVGILHMLTHIPTHPLFSKYLHSMEIEASQVCLGLKEFFCIPLFGL